jgi:pentatricopeptide repeat protein
LVVVQGIEPDTLTFNELINICVEGGDMASAARLLQNMSQRGLSPDVMTFTTLIKGYGRTGNLTSAFDCVREMKEREVGVSVSLCSIGLAPWHAHPRLRQCNIP